MDTERIAAEGDTELVHSTTVVITTDPDGGLRVRTIDDDEGGLDEFDPADGGYEEVSTLDGYVKFELDRDGKYRRV